MKKDMKIGIIGTLVSAFIFDLGMFMLINSSFPVVVNILGILCTCIGGFLLAVFINAIIMLLWNEHQNKKADKYNRELIKEIKSKLPKKTEFSVNISDKNHEKLNELLYGKLKCTVLFDGSKVHIKFSLPEEVNLETDDLRWFYENFDFYI